MNLQIAIKKRCRKRKLKKLKMERILNLLFKRRKLYFIKKLKFKFLMKENIVIHHSAYIKEVAFIFIFSLFKHFAIFQERNFFKYFCHEPN